MVHGKSCEGCSEAHDCKKIYEQLGQTGGPSVAWKVVVAFVLPLLSFVGALAFFGHLLRAQLAEPYQTPVVFFLALAVAASVVLISSVASKRRCRAQ